MIDKILNKAKQGQELSDEEFLELLNIDNDEDLEKLFKIACDIRDNQSKVIKLTSTVHLTNKCQIQPRCEYCGFAEETSEKGYYNAFYKSNDEILKAVKSIQEAHIPRVSCSGGYGYKGKQAVNACRIVKGQSDLEILVNVGGDLTEKSVQELAELGADTICCNLETINEDVFYQRKPGDSLDQRILTCKRVSDAGVGLSSGLLLGLGETKEDRINAIVESIKINHVPPNISSKPSIVPILDAAKNITQASKFTHIANTASFVATLGPKCFVTISIHIKESHETKIPPSIASQPFS